MGLFAKILAIAACGIGIICTLGAISNYTERIKSSYKTDAEKAAIGCLFIAFFIFCGVAIFLFITLCCKCSETVMGILVSVAGGFACVFAIVAFASFHKPLIDLKGMVPNVGEWLFGSIIAGATVILTAMTMAVS
ncbi:hypothetical protein CRM22_001488 [Opisthorchis felineus]|uniref:MARVEL domain-containing protein n=1 Tax=Opisthorchis felineus TaxID=147828 RepID=A0A4S2MAK4_OPIFE|nr:hypothetical protein CRM22_001488 [Opisthorchis felineus]